MQYTHHDWQYDGFRYADDSCESLVGFDLREIQEVWVGDDCRDRDLSTRLVGHPAVLETQGVPCCLGGIADDGDLFVSSLYEITCVIARVGDRKQALYFPNGLLGNCESQAYAD